MRLYLAAAMMGGCLAQGYGSHAWADTVHLKDRSNLKGLVVEDYADRVVVSTAEGEIEVMKARIQQIVYDNPEQNLFALGRSYEERGYYEEALRYYQQALAANPDFTPARDRLLFVRSGMWHTESDRMKRDIDRKRRQMEMVRDFHAGVPLKTGANAQHKLDPVERSLGLSLAQTNDGWYEVEDVLESDRALGERPQDGDLLVSIWSVSTRYGSWESVAKQLIGPKYSQVKVGIQRSMMLKGAGSLGWRLEIRLAGLTVVKIEDTGIAITAGLKPGDRIVTIGGKPTRYMPLTKAREYIEGGVVEGVVVDIQRDVSLMRGEFS